MAQEQAKSAPGKATPDDKDEVKGPLEAMMQGKSKGKPDDGPTLPRRSSLADRLKAEQRKREEPKREEPRREEMHREEPPRREDPLPQNLKAPQEDAKPAEMPESSGAAASPKHLARTRRPAGPPPQRRLSAPANDDIPSIGGLIFALQQRPSRTPFLIAFAASAVWFVIGGFFAYGVISNTAANGGFLSAPALAATAAILVPIVIFWFLALLVWRAQELRLMASAMTEVAVRLAEPDKLAEQSVASVGQTIRRQVAAMNDAISRAIGRASELEAMVHNEVAALERSYGENELRVRNLINELATERDALTNNSQRVSEALKGVGAAVARDIANASGSIDKKLAERGTQLTELLVTRSSEAAEQVHKAQAKVAEQVPGLLERLTKEQGRLTKVIEGATTNLTALESQVAQRTTALDKTMKERTEALQSSLSERIKGLESTVAQGAIILDKTLSDRTEAFNTAITQNAGALDKTMKERAETFMAEIGKSTEVLDQALKDRTDTFTGLVAEGAVTLDKTLADRTAAFTNVVAESAVTLDKTLTDRTSALTNVVAESAVTLDKTLAERTAAFTNVVAEGAVTLEKTLTDKTAALTNVVAESAVTLDKTLEDRTQAFTNVVAEGAVTLDKTLAERTEALTAAVTDGAAKLDTTIAERTDALTGVVAQGAVAFEKTLQERTDALAAAVENRTSAVDKTLADRTAQFTSAVNQGAIALDRTMAERADSFTKSLLEKVKGLESAITQQTESLEKTMGERAQLVITALAERLKAIDATFGQRTAETDKMLGEHTRLVDETFGKQTAQLNEVLAANSQMMHETAEQVGAQSKEAVGILTSQTGNLREVSKGLLEQIHGLTQRFENQGQAILTAAKALDSSNAKIDSILEGRHQSIIALLHTVNTKAQELDGMMGNYAGIVEGALNQAEQRAKQVTTALGRDTAGQAQQALAQIEKLREEAQAHTARAVTDLKGSFETVITQIGRQLEQMRGQFDNTSRGMREAARQTATDLDALRQEMQKRMDTLPEQTAQATAAIRKALNDQFREIEAMTPSLSRAAAPAPSMGQGGMGQGNMGGGDAYRQQPAPQPQPAPFPARAEEHRSSGGDYGLPPMPRFDARGRQVSGPYEAADLDQSAGGLAQQLSNAPGRGGWTPSEPAMGGGRGGMAASGAGQLRIDELSRAIDNRTAADVWYRMRAGERGVLGRHIYTYEGQATFEEISGRYDREGEFRNTVDRYIADFERLLAEAEQSDPAGNMLQNYLVSETGRVYLLLAHASGRLR
jgi:DNA anti-recombination protein RmuC